MKKLLSATLVLIAALAFLPVTTFAATTVPGHTGKFDEDDNGIPDAGYFVNGHYYSVYGEDKVGNWYWDLGDGRVWGNVGSLDALDDATQTVCDYVINYRADFGNDPFMNTGWIQNHINCKGYEPGHFNYLIVHADDERYTGNPDAAVWGDWEFVTYNVTGLGNIVKNLRDVI